MSSFRNNGSELLLLVLSQIPGIGPARMNALVRRLGADFSLLDAGEEEFRKVPGIGETLARDMATSLKNASWRQTAREKAEQQLGQLDRLKACIVTILDSRYPALLRQIYDPPPLLFVRGDPGALSRPSISIVGTRRATSYGTQVTERICRGLVLNGQAIVSGLAYGIDMAAHKSAIDGGGTTIAVLGCGIDIIYTDPEGRLWPRIIGNGAIISEEWIGIEPVPRNFPRRNRIIAGLSRGTLVVESDLKGGSMITAAAALESNREVFAVPGSIFSRASRGTNRLIQQCQAKLVLSADDILTELSPGQTAPTFRPVPEAQPEPCGLGREESAIMAVLTEEPLHIDLIAEKTGMAIATLMLHLFELELKELLVQEAGHLFRKRN